MTTPSVFQVSEVLHMVDGVVIGPVWSDDCCRELLRSLRLVKAAAPDDPDGFECDTDLPVAARVFHEVLTLSPATSRRPVFAGEVPRTSLYKSAVLHAHDPGDLAALARISDQTALGAANVARWLLKMPQQRSATLVFASPPPEHASSARPRSKYATARPVALAC